MRQWRVYLDRALDVDAVAQKIDLVHQRLDPLTDAASPALVGCDTGSHAVDIEYLDLGVPIGEAIRRAIVAGDLAPAKRCLTVAASALVAIHQAPIPEEEARAGEDIVLVHGDFGFSNVFVSVDDGSVAVQVIDPLPRATGTDLRFGNRELDVAMMLSCLLGRPPLSVWRHVRDRRVLRAWYVAEYQRLSGRRLSGLREAVRVTLRSRLVGQPPVSRWVRRAAFPLIALSVPNQYD